MLFLSWQSEMHAFICLMAGVVLKWFDHFHPRKFLASSEFPLLCCIKNFVQSFAPNPFSVRSWGSRGRLKLRGVKINNSLFIKTNKALIIQIIITTLLHKAWAYHREPLHPFLNALHTNMFTNVLIPAFTKNLTKVAKGSGFVLFDFRYELYLRVLYMKIMLVFGVQTFTQKPERVFIIRGPPAPPPPHPKKKKFLAYKLCFK